MSYIKRHVNLFCLRKQLQYAQCISFNTWPGILRRILIFVLSWIRLVLSEISPVLDLLNTNEGFKTKNFEIIVKFHETRLSEIVDKCLETWSLAILCNVKLGFSCLWWRVSLVSTIGRYLDCEQTGTFYSVINSTSLHQIFYRKKVRKPIYILVQ